MQGIQKEQNLSKAQSSDPSELADNLQAHKTFSSDHWKIPRGVLVISSCLANIVNERCRRRSRMCAGP